MLICGVVRITDTKLDRTAVIVAASIDESDVPWYVGRWLTKWFKANTGNNDHVVLASEHPMLYWIGRIDGHVVCIGMEKV